MSRQLVPIAALLLGSFFLMLAGGVNGLILPVRGQIEGFSALSLGLLGTGWALGYISGCIATPRMVARVGHIRSFGVLASLASLVVLGSLLLMHPGAWVVLRAVAGFCFAGAAMIVESWLSERTDSAIRGRVFGVYTAVNLAGTTIGQMLLTLGDASGFLYFVVAAMFYSLALLPTALSTVAAPQPLQQVSLDLPALWRNSPIAVVGVVLIGVSNSAFGTLGAVFGGRINLDITSIALLMSFAILAGALIQMPVGYLSDRIDRRWVLVGLAGVAALVDSMFVVIGPTEPMIVLSAAAVFGGMIYSMYPVIVAHANDHAAEGAYLKTSGGLLLLFGVGSIAGPLVAGWLMASMGPSGLFATTLGAHLLIIFYALLRIRQRAPVATEEKTDFVPMQASRPQTPETMAMHPLAEEEVEAQVAEAEAEARAEEEMESDAAPDELEPFVDTVADEKRET